MEITYDSPYAAWDDHRYTWDGVFIPDVGPLAVDRCFYARLARRHYQALRQRRKYVARAACRIGGRMTPARWQAKSPAEILVATFDFADELDGGETLTAVTIDCALESGNDPSPGLVLYGPETVEATQVLQPFSGGVDGATYKLVCTATTTAGRVLICAGIFPVRAP